MKNWNDEGSVHYDASTNQRYTEVRISFEHNFIVWNFKLAIPLAMRPVLKGEHYDQAVYVAKRTIDAQLIRSLLAGETDVLAMRRTAQYMAWEAILEHLYNEFHLIQAAAGNRVWATPERMQDVGPKPEDDPIN